MPLDYTAKPFVKWAGGKSWLVPCLERMLPTDLGRRRDFVYVEPFIGGGAVLFWMLGAFPGIKRACVNDVNEELVTTYRVVRDSPGRLVKALERLRDGYVPLDGGGRKEYYLRMRDFFNGKNCGDVETAALFIFLNRTCFNGLYRVNSKGEFNVPHGRYANPKICDGAVIAADSGALEKTEISCGDYSALLEHAGRDSFFYLDPPYRPVSRTASFTSYSREGFGDDEQRKLGEFCRRLDAAGARFLLSNSDTGDGFFDEIYRGFRINRVYASRMINSDGRGRGKVAELLVSNF